MKLKQAGLLLLLVGLLSTGAFGVCAQTYYVYSNRDNTYDNRYDTYIVYSNQITYAKENENAHYRQGYADGYLDYYYDQSSDARKENADRYSSYDPPRYVRYYERSKRTSTTFRYYEVKKPITLDRKYTSSAYSTSSYHYAPGTRIRTY